MAPSKFQIYVDQSMRQPNGPPAPPQQPPQQQQQHHHHQQIQPPPVTVTTITATATKTEIPLAWPRYVQENLDGKNMRFTFDLNKLFPLAGGEYSFEELRYFDYIKKQKELALVKRCEELERENEELRQHINTLTNTLRTYQNASSANKTAHENVPSPPRNNRLSIVPQSLQPDYVDMSCSIAYNDAPSIVHAAPEMPTVVQDFWKQTCQFTVPIDQSQYIRENVPTSTPTSKSHDIETKRPNRRISRPSMGGSPTMKLSPITETSRECNSKSSSSSSASTPGTVKKPLMMEPIMIDEPDRPLDPNDPTTYRKLLRALAEPIERRPGYIRLHRNMPNIGNGVCFDAGEDNFLVDKELSKEAKMFTAQLLNDDDSDADMPAKTICLRVDRPANEWMYYICNELHRRLIRQKTKPDIELSVMNAEPAIIYADGSILVDEYFRFVSLEDYLVACAELKKPFPKSFAAYLTLELIQTLQGMHSCNILHLDINPKNIIVTGCPNREDIASVNERTSLIKLIGFDHAMDQRLLPDDFKFKGQLKHLCTCGMLDSKSWTYEVDWYGALNCIYRMFFLEEMIPVKEGDRWHVKRQFKGFPTDIWGLLFEELLNIDDLQTTSDTVSRATEELSTWIKANIIFVLKEAANLDMVLEEFCKLTNKSVRI